MKMTTVLVAAAVAALASPALADTQRRDVYQGRPTIVDGDTLRIGGDELRLWGVDAPERNQICLMDGRPMSCGLRAAEELRGMIGRASIRCIFKDWNPARLAEHKDRAVVQCMVHGIDLGDWLTSRGLATPFFNPAYLNVGLRACESRMGFYAGAFTEPSQWRRTGDAAAHGLGAQSSRSCRQAFRAIASRMRRP